MSDGLESVRIDRGLKGVHFERSGARWGPRLAQATPPSPPSPSPAAGLWPIGSGLCQTACAVGDNLNEREADMRTKGIHDLMGPVVGLLLAALYNPVWTAGILNAQDFALAVGAFLLLFLWNAPPWLVVFLCGASGALLGAI